MTEATSPPNQPTKVRRGLGIQSKLLAMLLGVSLISALVIGIVGYISGRESLRQAALDRMTSLRTMRVAEIENAMDSLRTGVELDSRNASAVEGAAAFIAGFDALKSATITQAQQAKLDAFYRDSFVPALEERAQRDYDPAAFVPATPAGRYLQAWYTAPRGYDDYDAGLALHDAGDGSAWTKANAKSGPYFTGLVDTLGYADVLVLNKSADVVYAAYKSVDLGVSMHEEPYTQSVLTKAFDEVMRNGSLDEVIITDFERYLPSLNVPTAWVISPIGTATNIEGALAVQVPVDQINAVMTGDGQWVAQGLGQTGEVYLAGPDRTMRSVSRELLEDPEAYKRDVIANGTPVGNDSEALQSAGGAIGFVVGSLALDLLQTPYVVVPIFVLLSL
ncbi:MAG: adenylate/guanylate cyclase domain-containing protein, partial [Gammaproteobacteria bacterium]